MDFDPEVIAPGHGAKLTKTAAQKMEERLKLQKQHFEALIADPDTDFGGFSELTTFRSLLVHQIEEAHE